MKKLLPEEKLKEVDSGCCGMAGSFGYEKKHESMTTALIERKLQPAIDAQTEDTEIVACGTSCRHQIKHFTGRQALHWVEVIQVKN